MVRNATAVRMTLTVKSNATGLVVPPSVGARLVSVLATGWNSRFPAGSSALFPSFRRLTTSTLRRSVARLMRN